MISGKVYSKPSRKKMTHVLKQGSPESRVIPIVTLKGKTKKQKTRNKINIITLNHNLAQQHV